MAGCVGLGCCLSGEGQPADLGVERPAGWLPPVMCLLLHRCGVGLKQPRPVLRAPRRPPGRHGPPPAGVPVSSSGSGCWPKTNIWRSLPAAFLACLPDTTRFFKEVKTGKIPCLLCLPACLPACRPACLPACLPAWHADPALQELHRTVPMIACWDDHEIS